MSTLGAAQLIDMMKADPEGFHSSGKAYDLLQFYFHGYPLDTLRPLLQSGNRYILRCVSFIASELAIQAWPLAEEMIPLLQSEDPHIVWDAVEVLAVCSVDGKVSLYSHIVRMLESGFPPIRELAAWLMSRAEVSQLIAARQWFEKQPDGALHSIGLGVLLGDQGPSESAEHASNDLLRLYAEIAAERHRPERRPPRGGRGRRTRHG